MTAMLLGTKANEQLVKAAGGVVLREDAAGVAEVAIVHRPGRDDWSFPKGKLDPGESYEDCARREVLEETGYLCRLVGFVGFTQYRDRRDRPKVVGYWAMEVLTGEFVVSREVDALRWLTVDDALALLTYERDRDLLVSLRAFLLARSG